MNMAVDFLEGDVQVTTVLPFDAMLLIVKNAEGHEKVYIRQSVDIDADNHRFGYWMAGSVASYTWHKLSEDEVEAIDNRLFNLALQNMREKDDDL